MLGTSITPAGRHHLADWILKGTTYPFSSRPNQSSCRLINGNAWEVDMITCLMIWKARCKMIFDNKMLNTNAIV